MALPETTYVSTTLRLRPLNDSDARRVAELAERGMPESAGAACSLAALPDNAVEASQDEIYHAGAAPVVSQWLAGYDAAVMAYGTTGSGKTHTMIGPESDRGVMWRAARAGLNALANGDTMHLSAYDLYCGRVQDMLSKDRTKLKVRARPCESITDQRAGWRGVAEGATVVEVPDEAAFDAAMARVLHNRTVWMTYMSAASSRSTLFISLTLTQADGTSASLHLVDLAGAENVHDARIAGPVHLAESKAIGRSLDALVRVVLALVEKRKHVPYRDSRLTMLLRTALGGNACASLIATLVPLDVDAGRNSTTLKFAAAIARVRNVAVPAGQSADAQARAEAMREADMATIAPQPLAWTRTESAAAGCGVIEVIMPWGAPVACIATSPEEWHSSRGLVIALHGYGKTASADSWKWGIEAYADAGYAVIAINMPGFGGSPGPRSKARSEDVTAPGGPLAVVVAVLNAVGWTAPVAVLGYDWGAAIALELAKSRPWRVAALVLMHAMVTETKRYLKIKTPSLILWVPTDVFHPRKTAVALHRALKSASLSFFHAGQYKASKTRGNYACVADQLVPLAVAHVDAHLSGVAVPAQSTAPPASLPLSVAPTRELLIQDAVAMVRAWDDDGSLGERICAVVHLHIGSSAPQLKRESAAVFAALPIIGTNRETTSAELVALGVWASAPIGVDALAPPPSLEPGSRLAVSSRHIRPLVEPPGAYLAYDAETDYGEAFTNQLCTVVSSNETTVRVAIPTADGGNAEVTLDREAAERGSIYGVPGYLSRQPNGTLVFEDLITADYSVPAMRAIMLRAALQLESVAIQIEVSCDGDEAINDAARAAVPFVVWSTVDMSRLQDGVDRRRNTSHRVEQLVTGGQGHCHGLSSAMAALLLPFCDLLGMRVAYCRGYTLRSDDDAVRNDVDRHQWLQISMLPSGRSYTCDVSRYGLPAPQQQHDRSTLAAETVALAAEAGALLASPELALPIELAYSLAGARYVALGC
ncbi:uncharacterized protein AMSG_04078 [Thecamonas trahens ATCC 50062]|uniref:Kinesin-like protein n=1 Tax=Thecamonas trahens ATCC 50062 TaxID=461836 RepID=A0A0L0D968_THETB|nr:hypothetical protein AMSG_04078 [Thecamonas trahens ATCC 50062]KNC47848.1 hypothetical protein AMSG_04078 [Thecamonas trahens ATCC 50062]|eukprot:XP_013759326.1 hypothetical protein AMSG_04078 [Thecamonas trahens ATCC 50062]